MGNFQVYDAFSILFQFEKPHVEHLEGFIFLSKKSGKLNFFSKLLIGNSNSRTRRNSPTRSAKDSASMVGGMFMVGIMSC